MSVDLTLAKSQCRVTGSSEDTIIAAYLAAAIAWIENYTYKKLTAASSVSQEEAAFPGVSQAYGFRLLWGPIDTIASVSIAYTDENGDSQTISNARVVKDRVYPPLDTDWPAIEANSGITISYDVGYSSVPAEIDQATLLLVGEYHDNRSAGVTTPALTDAVTSLLAPYRLHALR